MYLTVSPAVISSGLPAVVVLHITSNVQHVVEYTRSTQDLASRPAAPASIHPQTRATWAHITCLLTYGSSLRLVSSKGLSTDLWVPSCTASPVRRAGDMRLVKARPRFRFRQARLPAGGRTNGVSPRVGLRWRRPQTRRPRRWSRILGGADAGSPALSPDRTSRTGSRPGRPPVEVSAICLTGANDNNTTPVMIDGAELFSAPNNKNTL